MNMELKNVQHIHEEIRGILNKADDKFEETTKKMENYVHTKLFEVRFSFFFVPNSSSQEIKI